MFPVSVKANGTLIVTIWTLVFIPVGNVFLYVVSTNDFLYLLKKNLVSFVLLIISVIRIEP